MYECRVKILSSWLNNPKIEKVSTIDLRGFLYYLRTDYIPFRPDGDETKLTEATIHGYWKAIRALWKWASEDLEIENVAVFIKAPK